MNFYMGIALVLSALLAVSAGPTSGKKSCPANEIYFECGANCQSECDTLGEPCMINYFRCPDGCYCIDNYARLSPGGKCVPIEKCPKKL
ncbi:unnamed protein product [Hermetia illucens]|uniref:TIL domain-containing protein n=1 Tax=Hermetia illucens TaxID=343691 RepID=A0A7R8UXI2_HERIL|nr:chymotrypsin inhibitor Ani s 6-like [Hermetia illucens]CAD7088942.1 unnamed protein product [Hermetia illucens]